MFLLFLLLLGDLALGLAMTEKRAKHIALSFPYLPLALNVLVEKELGSKTGEKLLCLRCRFRFDLNAPFRKAAGNRT